MVTITACGQMQVAEHESGLIRHIVKKGETLYAIASHYSVDYQEVAIWNQIEPPYEIYLEQELVIIPPYDQLTPLDELIVEQENEGIRYEPPVPPLVQPVTSNTVITPKASKKQPKIWQTTPNSVQKRSGISWQWPHVGKVKRGFNPVKGQKGLDISGEDGSAVYASADGVVIYSGNNLKGYGNLLIIRHSDEFLSAYGHNRRLLVHKGTNVKRGEQIAEMGIKQSVGPLIHFEIRKNGKPVNPLRLLPVL
jgi:lipoprotein NlpD